MNYRTQERFPRKNPRFRRGYVLKPGFNYGALRPYCDSIVHVSDGFKTEPEEICQQLQEGLQDFDPKQDCIVPVGNAMVNVLSGYILHDLHPGQDLTVALYTRERRDARGYVISPDEYVFYTIPVEVLTAQKTRG